MAQPQLLQIKLSRFDAQPWGFRLQGGVDFATPLVVQKVNGGSLAEKAGLIPGDAVLKINDVDVFNLRHKDAQDVVVRSGNNFVLTVQRGGSTWRPHVTPTGNIPQPQQNSPYLQTVTKTSLAHKQQESQHIGCGYNNAARPFANGGDGNVKSIVNKQYNTPVGIYSDESIAETLSAQAEVLAGGVLGVNFKKNEKEYQPDKSEVLKFLREEETGASTPEPPAPANFYWTQSHAIGGNERRTPLSHKHQQLIPEEQPKDDSTGTNLQENKLYASSAQRPSLAQPAKPSSSEPADPRVIIMPVCPALQGPEYKAEMEAAAAALQHDDGPRPLSASGHPACALCGVGIVGVFVRIKDKNLHVECFKCATCGTSLKNQGYYNYNNKLYCDIHAKLAALQNPPSGTDGYVPVPIKPNTKLSANTISSALNAHGFSEIPVANGGSVAPPTAPINQGYARPFGAAPAVAPKSPVAYPPQRPAVNPYATLPRTNIGQQGRRVNTYNNYTKNYSIQFKKPLATNYGSNKYATMPAYNTQYNNYYNQGLTDIKTNAQATAIATANAANAIDLGASQAPHTATAAAATATATTSFPPPNTVDKNKSNAGLDGLTGVGGKGAFGATSAPKRGRGIFNKAVGPGVRVPLCSSCNIQIRGPFITALGRIWCPEHFICVNANCRRPLQDIGFVEEKGDLYCEYCFEKYLAPTCSKCGSKIKGDCLNAIGKQFHPECFTCGHCGKLFGNTPFFLEDGNAYCEADWNELFTTKCFACGFPVEAGDRWVEALNHNYHSQCFNCTYCKQNLEGQSFYNKGGRPFCKNHAR
ncbi:PDZ and LIM domain protein Zasp isoform X7 [Bactrocera dorsalis]|uniref:PDZ and LIM domain protein Zasp isoform X7 n=1 Tax=Bactrocera dorsalis TaxID=27457 RepID=A0ABM3JHW4_BACDO|nr:PDZ and LIM domain protein Zasp isoform X7 [Bactrocera dorsalis]